MCKNRGLIVNNRSRRRNDGVTETRSYGGKQKCTGEALCRRRQKERTSAWCRPIWWTLSELSAPLLSSRMSVSRSHGWDRLVSSLPHLKATIRRTVQKCKKNGRMQGRDAESTTYPTKATLPFIYASFSSPKHEIRTKLDTNSLTVAAASTRSPRRNG